MPLMAIPLASKYISNKSNNSVMDKTIENLVAKSLDPAFEIFEKDDILQLGKITTEGPYPEKKFRKLISEYISKFKKDVVLNDSGYAKDIWDNKVDKSKLINAVLFKSNEKFIIYLWINDASGGNIYWEKTTSMKAI